MRKLGLHTFVALMALVLTAGAAGAGQALFSPLDIAPSYAKSLNQDKSYQVLADSPATASLELVKANANLVDEKAATLTFNLGSGLDLQAHRVQVYATGSG